jgi:hypothetical protein
MQVALSLSTMIHLAAFFLVTVSLLFIDQLFVGRISLVAEHVTIYGILFILIVAVRQFFGFHDVADACTCIQLVVPWVVLVSSLRINHESRVYRLQGLMSSRKESRLGMILFFIISLGFLVVWGAMFASPIYGFMFFTWSFFATASIFACLLVVTLLCLSVYAFLNFGLGLTEYRECDSIHVVQILNRANS